MKTLLKLQILCLFSALATLPAVAARTDTVTVRSVSMEREIPVIVIVPERADAGTPVPVVYMLHGFGGDYTTWPGIKPALPEIADREGFAIVCPDGGRSWYIDSPQDAGSRYETFFVEELIPFVDGNYPVVAAREGRAVMGLSMGGYGAMTLAIRHKELFGAVGSTSGGLDIRPFPHNWELDRLLGGQDENPGAWEAFTPINLIPRLENGDLRILIDCGYGDFFLDVNRAFHERLLQRGIDHDFYLRPGCHNADYWADSVDYQLLFFRKFFDRRAE